MDSEALASLAALPAETLRARLPELFTCIDAASEANAPLVASLAGRAFEGEEGLALLCHESSLPFVRRGLTHGDSQVRSLTATHLARLATTASGVSLLCERGVLTAPPCVLRALGRE